jgi:hypothetical protein
MRVTRFDWQAMKSQIIEQLGQADIGGSWTDKEFAISRSFGGRIGCENS